MRLLLPIIALLSLAAAETGLKAWLRYAPFPGASSHVSSLPSTVVALNATESSPVHTAGKEIREALAGIFNATVKVQHPPIKNAPSSKAVVIGTVDEYEKAYGALATSPDVIKDGYWLDTTGANVQILGQNERGALYGAFAYIEMLATGNFSKSRNWNTLDHGELTRSKHLLRMHRIRLHLFAGSISGITWMAASLV